jgi:twitching motility two-component system response regulator PilG
MTDAPVKLEGVKIMVIDDSNTILRSAEIYLKQTKNRVPTGLEIAMVTDGFNAIPQIMEFKPHIIFLDVTMERVDGFTLCKALKSNPETADIRVLMLTSKDGIFDKAKGKDAMADEYITKPFTREQILDAVRRNVALVPNLATGT